MKKNILTEFPTPREYFIETPLYYEVNMKMFSAEHSYAIQLFEGTIDSYCIECDQTSVFQPKDKHWIGLDDYQEDYLDDNEFVVVLKCTRNNNHTMHFYFIKRGGMLSKIGQSPSLADLVTYDIGKYRRVLGSRYTEYTRAIGLAANGIGIGSYTYLRRVFFDLIDKAHTQAGENLPSKEEFLNLRVKDKIIVLKDYLPKIMVKNANIYSILSKGIHELSEEECIKYFATLKMGIELILDEEIQRKDMALKTKNITDEIGRISGGIK